LVANAIKGQVTLPDYRKQISFRFVQPRTRLPKGYGEVSKLFRWVGLPMDILNTRLPQGAVKVPAILRELCGIPRMSTIGISALINWAVSRMPDDQSFVNVGVWHGYTFLSGIASNPGKLAAGIDNFSLFGGPRDAFGRRFEQYKGPRHTFHEMDYREYFQKVHRGPIGFYIYDGDHSYENQLEGLRIAEPFLAKDSLVLIDDTNRDAARQATLDFVSQREGRFRVILDEPTARNCHPTFWDGIMVLQKVN